jgi:hypothetical protein
VLGLVTQLAGHLRLGEACSVTEPASWAPSARCETVYSEPATDEPSPTQGADLAPHGDTTAEAESPTSSTLKRDAGTAEMTE